jgi:hypothetical protein
MEAEKKQISDNQLADSIYKPNLLNWNFIILGILFLVIGFIFNIPIKEKLADIITTKLASSESCPIFFERLDIGEFLQEVNLFGPIISGKCLDRQNSIRFDQITANLSLPTLSPPGLKMHLEIKDEKSALNLYPIISYPNYSVEIMDTNIQGPLLEKLIGGSFQLKGDFKIDSNIKMESGDLLEGDLKIISSNFVIPRQTISGFNVPALLLRNFGIKGNIAQKNIIDFSSIILGDKDSMVFMDLSGKLTLNKEYFQQSKLELAGKIRFSKDFITSFPILNLLLSGKAPGPDGQYNIKIEGPISSVKPSIY